MSTYINIPWIPEFEEQKRKRGGHSIFITDGESVTYIHTYILWIGSAARVGNKERAELVGVIWMDWDWWKSVFVCLSI